MEDDYNDLCSKNFLSNIAKTHNWQWETDAIDDTMYMYVYDKEDTLMIAMLKVENNCLNVYSREWGSDLNANDVILTGEFMPFSKHINGYVTFFNLALNIDQELQDNIKNLYKLKVRKITDGDNNYIEIV